MTRVSTRATLRIRVKMAKMPAGKTLHRTSWRQSPQLLPLSFKQENLFPSFLQLSDINSSAVWKRLSLSVSLISWSIFRIQVFFLGYICLFSSSYVLNRMIANVNSYHNSSDSLFLSISFSYVHLFLFWTSQTNTSNRHLIYPPGISSLSPSTRLFSLYQHSLSHSRFFSFMPVLQLEYNW